MARENENIKKLLIEKNMTQKELSISSGVTEAAISHYVKGDRIPRGANLTRIANALEVSPDYLKTNVCFDRNEDLKEAKLLIARNASQMSKQEKMEFVSLLLTGLDNCD